MKPDDEALPRVEILPYDPSWLLLYRREEQTLRAALSPPLVDLEHIGSTAVPNLSAKPIIDMMASTQNLQEIHDVTSKLHSLGYNLIQTGMKNRLLYRKTASPPSVGFHLHIVAVETWNNRKERTMRDYLLRHPSEAVAYGLLKEKLAAHYVEDSLGYTKAKTDFIQKLMDQAHDELGLPHVEVWET